jgi:prepilin-type N-terminal cleavage/methylation domain-containing protein/prepilin-type processing-associated H-X9-DG protein
MLASGFRCTRPDPSNLNAPASSSVASNSVGRRGFTLVELLVVIGIIALLIAILVPVLSKARESSNRTACLSNLRSIGQGLYLYAHVYKDCLPNGNPPGRYDDYDGQSRVMVEFNKSFVKSPAVFHCPSDTDPVPTAIDTADYDSPNSARVSYEFYSLWWAPAYGPKLASWKGQAPVAWDLEGGEPFKPGTSTPIYKNVSPYRNHIRRGQLLGGNVLFSDGHVEWQDAGLWETDNVPTPASKFWRGL